MSAPRRRVMQRSLSFSPRQSTKEVEDDQRVNGSVGDTLSRQRNHDEKFSPMADETAKAKSRKRALHNKLRR
eukprot:Seg483.10 transcript_id=Seg483.10/GoldUCD/mRNA.D3Y31 product="hypothetical protein" protein_id=Seg483.10/GoldUCD/D3Y31